MKNPKQNTRSKEEKIMIKKRLVKKTTAIAITGALTIAMTASV